MVVDVLLVLIEWHHLCKHLLSYLVDRCELERRDSDLYIAESADDWLDLGVFDAVQRLDHHQVVFLLRILHYCRFHGGEVLLVR